jgi:hypothetical protein
MNYNATDLRAVVAEVIALKVVTHLMVHDLGIHPTGGPDPDGALVVVCLSQEDTQTRVPNGGMLVLQRPG